MLSAIADAWQNSGNIITQFPVFQRFLWILAGSTHKRCFFCYGTCIFWIFSIDVCYACPLKFDVSGAARK